MQGVPLGLCGGSLPFILKKDLSYAAIGVFSTAMLPFSLKLRMLPIMQGARRVHLR